MSSTPNPARHPRVFISYSHDSPRHEDTVHELAEALRQRGVDTRIDRYDPNPKQGWPQWMLQQIQHSDFVLCICTTPYRERFENQKPSEEGAGARFEGFVITQEIYERVGQNEKFSPVLLETATKQDIPHVLRSYTHYVLPADFEKLYCWLTGQKFFYQSPLGSIQAVVPRLPRGSFVPTSTGESQIASNHLAIRIANARMQAGIPSQACLVLAATTVPIVDFESRLLSARSDLVLLLQNPGELRPQGFDLKVKGPAVLVETGRARRLSSENSKVLELWSDGTLIATLGKKHLCMLSGATSTLNERALTEFTYLFLNLAQKIYAIADPKGVTIAVHLRLLDLIANEFHVSLSKNLAPEPDVVTVRQILSSRPPEETGGALLAKVYAIFGVEPDGMRYCTRRDGEWTIDLSRFRSPGGMQRD